MILASLALIAVGTPGTTAGSGRPACTPAGATRTRLDTVLADPETWRGRCVWMVGIVSGSRLYADRAALADSLKDAGDGESQRSILLYRGRRVFVHRAALRVVIGTIDSCVRENEALATLRQADPDSFIMIGGFCHTSLDPYLSPIAVRRVSGQGAAR